MAMMKRLRKVAAKSSSTQRSSGQAARRGRHGRSASSYGLSYNSYDLPRCSNTGSLSRSYSSDSGVCTANLTGTIDDRSFLTESSSHSPRLLHGSKGRLIRKISESFIPSCVLIPSRSPLEELYRLFPLLPPDQQVLNVVTCALHKDILLQGRMFICTDYVCFYSNIFGYETRVKVDFKHILSIRREKTVFVVPNAISIVAVTKRYFFCSFLSRESVFDLLNKVWRGSACNSDEADESPSNQIKSLGESRDVNSNFCRRRPGTKSSVALEHSLVSSCNLPERPHTSPPALPSSASQASASFLDGENSFFRMAGDLTDGKLLGAGYGGSLPVRNCHLARASTFTDLRCLRKELWKKRKQNDVLVTPSTYRSTLLPVLHVPRVTSVKFRHGLFWWVLQSGYESLQRKNATLGVFLLLLLVVSLFTFTLMLRLNHVAALIKDSVSSEDYSSSYDARYRYLFQYRDTLHAAKVERWKAILSTNLEAVNEVQEMLKELKKKLAF